MTVKELKALLDNYADDIEIKLSADGDLFDFTEEMVVDDIKDSGFVLIQPEE